MMAIFSKKTRFRKAIFLLALLFLLVILLFFKIHQNSKQISQLDSTKSTSKPTSLSQPKFDKNKFSVNQADSLWVVVNKGRVLPSDYKPHNLTSPRVPLRLNAAAPEMQMRQEAAEALEKLVEAAQAQGLNLMLASGYRSYSEQVALYNGYVAKDGQVAADVSSARPGHSEHQTGLAADLEPANRKCELDSCFGDTPEGKWLAANAYKFGFIIRYTKDDQKITGYEYEPWHIRYLGSDLAKQIYDRGLTLEEYFKLPIYSDYPATSFQLK